MKQKKTGIIIAVVIIAIILIAAGAFTFLYFMTDLFKSNQELFWKYTSSSGELVKMLSNEKEENQKIWKDNHSYTSKGDLSILVTKETGTQEIKLGTTAKHSLDTGRTYADLTLYREGAEHLKASYINSDDIYAVYCKDIYEPYYIGFRNSNLKEFIAKMGGVTAEEIELPDSISLDMVNATEQLTAEEEKYLLDTYSEVLTSSISKEKYSKTEKAEVLINNQKYEAVGYHLDLTNDDIRQAVTNILTKAKDDEQTITILEKLLSGIDSNNIKTGMEELISSLSKATTPISYIKFSVYPVNKNIIKIQMTYNQTTEITIDIDNSKDNKTNLILSTNDTNTESGMEIAIEKQILSNMTIYTTSIKDGDYELTMNTSLGNIIDNKIENNSKITIFDNNATIETSYYKTIQEATEVEVEELTDSSAVIINNYPQEQLTNFSESIGEKIEQVIPEKIEQLNLRMTEAQDSLYYLQGIISSVITIMNANGVPQPVGMASATAIAAFNQVMLAMQNQDTTLNNSFSVMQEQEQKIFNNQFEMYKGDAVNGTIVKTLITTVVNSNTSYEDNEERNVSIKIAGDKIKKPSGWNEAGETNKEKLVQLSNNIQTGNQYTVAIEYNTKGFVEIITITEV